MSLRSSGRLADWVLYACLGAAVPVAWAVLSSGSPTQSPHDRIVAALSEVRPVAKDDAPDRDAEPLVQDSPEPEVWRGDALTLRVQKTRVALPGSDGGPSEVDAITYNGRLIGPTIRVRRGQTLKVKLVNDLPTAAPTLASPADQTDPPHDFHVTNLHTHGLHVSPTGASDDVFREIKPGQSFDYSFTIPADHPAGTFWYHPHKHGSVAYQMANGLAGALIVEGGGNASKVRDLEDIPEIAAARERTLVFQQLVLQRNKEGVGHVDPFDVYNEPPGPNAIAVTAVNGIVCPTFTMQPQEVQRWRLISAGRADALVLRWFNDKGKEIKNMPFNEIAIDGLALGSLVLRRDVTLYPGNRSDILVKAPAARGTYWLTALLENENPKPGEPVFIETRVARLVVQGPARPMKLPTSARFAPCRPFDSIDAAECKVKRKITFQYDEKKKIFRINGVSQSEQSHIDTVELGTAEEWTISAAEAAEGSADEPHPFHMHVNPFQVVRVEKVGTGVTLPADEWRDTIAVDKGKSVTIRIRFRDFAGKTVFHCHTLDHEDQGMMHVLRIVDPKQPDDSETPVTKLTECRTPAPPLTLPTALGKTWERTEQESRPVVVVFFRGMGCVHCTQELRRLVRESQEIAASGASLVAVSSEPIADPERALASLKVPTGLDFTLLVDERHDSFRAFGCWDEEPLHGLFVLDKAGNIRARYAGSVPFTDPATIAATVSRLGVEKQN